MFQRILSISVAVYNLPELTRRCFESLERSIESTPDRILAYPLASRSSEDQRSGP